MKKEKPLLDRGRWTQADFDDPNSDKNIYRNLVERDKNKILPGLKEFILMVRETLGITQEQMARQLDIKQSAYSRYENGSRRMPMETFLAMAEMVGYEIYIKRREEKLGAKDEIVNNYKDEKKLW